jgi:hypothetical protein
MQELLKKKSQRFYLFTGLSSLTFAILLTATLLALRLSQAHAQVNKAITEFKLPYSLLRQGATNRGCNIIERGWFGKELNCHYTGVTLYKNTGQPLQALMTANTALEAMGYQPDATTPGAATAGPNDFGDAAKTGHPSVFNYSDKKGDTLQLEYIIGPSYMPKELEGIKNTSITKENYLIGIIMNKAYIDLRL